MGRKWVATDFGGLDVLRLVEVPVAEPGPGEVTITVRAAGMNPADYKRFAPGPAADRGQLPLPLGFEVAGTLTAVGPGTEIASGGGGVGDDVLAFRISGGYASEITVPARDVFAKPPALTFPAAANLLLAGATAADMLRAAAVRAGDVVLVHGGSGAVGVSACCSRPACWGRESGHLLRAEQLVGCWFRGRAVRTGRGWRTGSGSRHRRVSTRPWTLSARTKPSTCPWNWRRTGRGLSRSRRGPGPRRRGSQPSAASRRRAGSSGMRCAAG